MEPQPFDCGNEHHRGGAAAGRSGFNGAAAFRLRKIGNAKDDHNRTLLSFNGAAAFRLRKCENSRPGVE